MYEDIIRQYNDLKDQMLDPSVVSDVKKLTEVNKKFSDLKEVAELAIRFETLASTTKESEEMLANETDPEMLAMAKEDIEASKEESEKLRAEISRLMRPTDPNDQKNIIMEIRAGTGGDESALFAAEMSRMYMRYAERRGWKTSVLDTSYIGIGGFKEISFEIRGKGAYSVFKFEAGTHRVQRVPETEKQGRVHTSTVTVAVLPEAEEIELEIKNEDLRIDTYAASGPGGQKVNTTNSAVRITHIPTGVVVQCQDQKDQHQNKEKALLVLRSRLLQKMEDDKNAAESAQRKSQIGTGERAEKIRTYNFPQDRITDHRIKQNYSNIPGIMDGNLDQIIGDLSEAEYSDNADTTD